jgi:hypothetical protein
LGIDLTSAAIAAARIRENRITQANEAWHVLFHFCYFLSLSLLLKRVKVRQFHQFTFARPPPRLHPVPRLHPAPSPSPARLRSARCLLRWSHTHPPTADPIAREKKKRIALPFATREKAGVGAAAPQTLNRAPSPVAPPHRYASSPDPLHPAPAPALPKPFHPTLAPPLPKPYRAPSLLQACLLPRPRRTPVSPAPRRCHCRDLPPSPRPRRRRR